MSTTSDLMADARVYLSRHLGGVDFSGYSNEVIRDCIESAWPGGWSDFESAFMRNVRETQRLALQSTEQLSPIKRKAMVEHYLGRRLKMYDEVVSSEFTPTKVQFVLSLATVDYRSRRDIVTSRRLELHVFTRETEEGRWSHQTIDSESHDLESHVRFGAINTPERDEATKEQVETCYRPGTEKAPMQGWVARAEMSHKQAHATERFQSPSTTKES